MVLARTLPIYHFIFKLNRYHGIMLSLIVTILFALAIAYFAIQNTLGVTLIVANNVLTDVPLYFVVISSVLLGIIMASLISWLNAFSAYRKLRGKDQIIEKDKKQIHDLQEKIMTLEAENTQLSIESGRLHTEDEAEQRPTFMHNLFHPRTESR